MIGVGTNLIEVALFAVFGLLIGSFLNVVIYRLPKMLERQWRHEFDTLSGEVTEKSDRFNLVVPRSRCPKCGYQITWIENIPIASYCFLKGKCRSCKAPIGLRYPIIELGTALLFMSCGYQWGISLTALLWCGFSAAMVTLAFIDWDTTLLPDDITLPLLWAGLIASSLGGLSNTLHSALAGAVVGYLSLWTVFWCFKLLTGKEGMGYGDFKLFAALGAWFGWQGLVPIILMSSVIGAAVGISMKFSVGLREGGYIPFGPFLAGAGLVCQVIGLKPVMQAMGL